MPFPTRDVTTRMTASFCKCLTVSNRRSLLKAPRVFHFSQAFHLFAPDSFVGNITVRVSMEFIVEHGSSIEAMHVFPINVIMKFMPTHPEKTFMEVVVINKREIVFPDQN